MNSWRLIVLILFAFLSASLRGDETAYEADALSGYLFIKKDDEAFALSPVFGLLPGGLVGVLDKTQVYKRVGLRGEPAIQIDLESLRSWVSDAALPLVSPIDLQVEPSTVRIVRIATFAVDKDGKKYGAGIRDSDHKERSYFLVYTDGPCAIGEVGENRSGAYTYDIRLASAGFHWLMVDEDRRITAQAPERTPTFTTEL